MRYTLKDGVEAFVGAFGASMFLAWVFLFGGVHKPRLAPVWGILITVVWLSILFYGLYKLNADYRINLLFDSMISFGVSVFLVVVVGATTLQAVISNPFSSPALIIFWVIIPASLAMDISNEFNVFKKYAFG